VPSVEAQAVRPEAFFVELGLERPHIAGSSMGGGIALELARRGSVRSVTGVSPVGFWTPRERE
jgi:pimeloyl-ACP methyl ester carboxylesterase